MKTVRLCIWVACLLGLNLATSQESLQVTALQYYYNTDPGVGVAGNGAIMNITPTGSLDQTFTFSVPASLTSGIHQLYVRCKDEYGRWSLSERRMFYISDIASGTRNLTAYQYFFDIDPGVGVPGTGAIVPITSTADFNTNIAIALPALSNGVHQLYIRVKDDMGRWSIAERRSFYVSDLANGTRNIIAYQFYFDSDQGVGVAGNGGIVQVASTAELNSTIAIPLPVLSNGFHQLYIRAKDDMGRWSIIERRSFMISPVAAGTNNIVEYQYYFNTDPGIGEAGNGGIVPVTATADLNSTLTIPLPSLSHGAHQLYIRTKDDAGHWSIAERRMFYISDVANNTKELTALEYYYDTDPGPGYANPFPITTTSDFDQIVDLGVPCLSTGTHYLYIRAKDTGNRWSIIDRDTLVITSGIEPSVVSPAGPLTMCAGSSVVLSTTAVTGVTYQWVESGVPIPGATSPSLTVTTSGSYALRTICGGFVLSNTVEVTIVPVNTYYADADNDGYGNPAVSLLDCTPPSGYVTNDDDCNDTNASIHPNAPESCNLLDDDCDSMTDEGVQTIFYVDTDSDGFGDPFVSQSACTAPSGYIPNNDDCDDTDAMINPDATEICNGTDDDCDGTVDEDVQTIFYADADNDGFGNPNQSILACAAPTGYVSDQSDCDDASAAVHPGVTEICNTIDDDCDSEIDEGFVTSEAASSVTSSDNNFCAGLSTTLNIEGGLLGTGAVWTWYEGGCGTGTAIGTGSSIIVIPSAGSHHYYVRAEGTCNTTACASTSITVYSTPSNNLCPASYAANNDATLCSSNQSYSVSFAGNPAPSLTYEFSGATTGSGAGTGSGSVFNEGTTTVTVTADNNCGSAICSFNVTINDTEDPVITGCPSNINTAVETGQWGAHANWTPPVANDNCAIESLTSSHSPGDFFVVGTTLVIYTATDIHGNISSCSFTVTVAEPDIIGDVNVSIFADDIEFSDMTPETGDFITVTATIHNPSGVDANPFTCRLINQYDGTVYADSLVTNLASGQVAIVNWIIETPGLPAFVPMQVVLDQFNVLDESNEFDNHAIRPFINGAFSLDAAINLSVYATSTVVAGNIIQLCGDAEYDNTALALDDYSVAGAQVTIEILETGQIVTGTTDSEGHFCIGYVTPLTPGSLSFVAEVTDFTLIGRSDSTSFLVTPPVIFCPADLDVKLKLFGSSLCGYPSDEVIIEGSPLTAQVTILNDCAEISLPTLLFIGASGGFTAPGPFIVPPLSPGQQLVMVIPAMTSNTIGTAHVTAVVDYSNIVTETDESNNTDSKIIKVHTAMPDIFVKGLSLNSTLICQANEVSIAIGNQGGESSGPFQVNVDMIENDVVVASYFEEIENIDPFCDLTISYAFVPVAGNEYVVQIECDAPGAVAELNESNNEIARDMNVSLCAPDLVLYDCAALDVKPADPQYPGTITLTATIANEGAGPSLDLFEIWFNVNGTVYPVSMTETIEINEVRTVTTSVPTPAPGDNFLIVTVDALGEIAEIDETNNTLADDNQHLCFDFKLMNMRCDDTPAIPGKQAICHPADLGVAVHNKTLYEATSLTLRYEISGPGLPPGWNLLGEDIHYMGNTCVCPLYVKFSEVFNYPATGLYSIRITADPDNVYTECEESNNVMIVSVNVLDGADYATFSAYIAPSLLNPAINEVVSFNLTYENLGCSAEDSLELILQVDNTPLDSLRAMPIDSGTYNTYPIPGSWSSGLTGLHIVKAIVDSDDEISEINESNNEATRALIVGTSPDFHVLTLVPSTYSPLLGEKILLTATISNEGGSDVTGKARFYYLGSNGNEIPIDVRTIFITVEDTIQITIAWSIVNPHSTLIVRASEADPVEYDFSDNEAEVQLHPLSLVLDITDNACYSLDEGTMEVQPIGGKPPYFIQWSNGRNDQLIEASAGIYTVTVTDANGSQSSAEGEIVVVGFPETRYFDSDDDGYGNPAISILSCDAVPGYVMNSDDCDDTQASIYPGAQEVCNSVDDDCDDLIDDEDPGITGQFTWYLDEDNDGSGSVDSLKNACIQPDGFVGNSNDCDDESDVVNPDAPEILDNVDNDCDGQIDEGLSSLSVDAGDCEVVFYGYSEESCHMLSVIASDGAAPYTYQWSNGATTSTTTVCPEVTTMYGVTVTDYNGFSAEDNVTVQVINVTCGNNNNKVLVCHIPPGHPENAHVICISPSAIPAHLDHGCYVGICDAPDPCEDEFESMVIEQLDEEFETSEHPLDNTVRNNGDEEISFMMKPNPADDHIEVLTNFFPGVISVMDISGKVILQQILTGQKNTIQTGPLTDGIYFIRVENEIDCRVKSIVIMH